MKNLLLIVIADDVVSLWSSCFNKDLEILKTGFLMLAKKDFLWVYLLLLSMHQLCYLFAFRICIV